MWADHERVDCHPSVLVVHLLDLNGLKYVLGEAGREGVPTFAPLATDVAGGPTNEAIAAFLHAHLQNRPENAIGFFLAEVLEAMNTFNRRANHTRMTWVTLWDSFMPFASEGPDRWLELVGVSRADFPRWIMALRYPVSAAGLTARPTIDDAGGNDFFYALPFQGPGRAMDLGVSPLAAPPVPEMVHWQIEHVIEHWKASGCLLGSTTGATRGEMEKHKPSRAELENASWGRDSPLIQPGAFTPA